MTKPLSASYEEV